MKVLIALLKIDFGESKNSEQKWQQIDPSVKTTNQLHRVYRLSRIVPIRSLFVNASSFWLFSARGQSLCKAWQRKENKRAEEQSWRRHQRKREAAGSGDK
jgi:hypothetical protein